MKIKILTFLLLGLAVVAQAASYKFTSCPECPDLDAVCAAIVESNMDNKAHSGATWKESDGSVTIFFVVPLSGSDETEIKATFPAWTPSGF